MSNWLAPLAGGSWISRRRRAARAACSSSGAAWGCLGSSCWRSLTREVRSSLFRRSRPAVLQGACSEADSVRRTSSRESVPRGASSSDSSAAEKRRNSCTVAALLCGELSTPAESNDGSACSSDSPCPGPGAGEKTKEVRIGLEAEAEEEEDDDDDEE